MMTSLVVGVGYVGSALVRALLVRGERVVALDNLFSTDEAAVAALGEPPAYELVRGSVADPAALEAAFRAAGGTDTVYLLAAQSSASSEAAPPEYTEETNLRGPRLVVEAMRRFGARTLVYASSLRVYGDTLPDRWDEDAPYGRLSDLAHLSKVYAEKLLEMQAARGEIRCLVVRLGLVYGLAPVMKADYRFMTAPNKFCLQAVRGEDLIVHGRSRTGLVHVEDAASAFLAIAEHPSFEGYAVVNAATEVAAIADVAALVADEGRRRGLKVRVRMPEGSPHPSPLPQGEGADGLPTLPVGEGASELLPLPVGEGRVEGSSLSRLASTAFRPTHDLCGGIAETLEYFMASGRPGQRS